MIAAGLVLSACARQPAAPPVSELLPSLAGDYTTVFEANGHGTRHFTHIDLPRYIQVLITCRGGNRAGARHGGGDLTAACGPMVAGNTTTIGRASDLTLRAAPKTRWALLVAGRNS